MHHSPLCNASNNYSYLSWEKSQHQKKLMRCGVCSEKTLSRAALLEQRVRENFRNWRMSLFVSYVQRKPVVKRGCKTTGKKDRQSESMRHLCKCSPLPEDLKYGILMQSPFSILHCQDWLNQRDQEETWIYNLVGSSVTREIGRMGICCS